MTLYILFYTVYHVSRPSRLFLDSWVVLYRPSSLESGIPSLDGTPIGPKYLAQKSDVKVVDMDEGDDPPPHIAVIHPAKVGISQKLAQKRAELCN